MQAAATAAATANNATLTVLAADNDPQKQYAQLQTVISSGQYDGIIVQPILSTGLTTLVNQAIAQKMKVVTMDQILGPDLTTSEIQVKGLSGSVVFNPSVLGTKFGKLVVSACASKNLDPCNVGYMYDLKASSLDVAIHDSFMKAIAGSPVKIVGEGEDFYTPSKGLSATQNLLQANPNINLIAASDQGIEGAVQAVSSAGKAGKVLLVGYGGSVAGIDGVKAGTWFGTIAQLPATEGKGAVNALVKAIRTSTVTPGSDPSANAPDGGVITSTNVSKFTGEWPG
ncbi:MAG: sugar ABC transporter substrate-binding protein [Actinomycetota bacterium]|nr:sugar ABC transporter substrate-binding protein [Actinomycetota bacterium]